MDELIEKDMLLKEVHYFLRITLIFYLNQRSFNNTHDLNKYLHGNKLKDGDENI